MGLSGKKIAVLVAAGFEDSELIKPVETLRAAGVKTTLIGLSEADKGGVVGKRGSRVPVEIAIDEAQTEDYDALLIPGGKSPAHLRGDQRVLDFTRSFDQNGRVIAAICHGPQVLISAGLMSGRKATSFFTVRGELKQAGATVFNRAVVQDGNLITSRGPGDIPQFTEALLQALDRTERKVA